jgi:hypothetical protein
LQSAPKPEPYWAKALDSEAEIPNVVAIARKQIAISGYFMFSPILRPVRGLQLHQHITKNKGKATATPPPRQQQMDQR